MFQIFLLWALFMFALALGVPASFLLYGTYDMKHPRVGCVSTPKGEVYYIGSRTTKGEEAKGVLVGEDGHRREAQARMINVDVLKVIDCPAETIAQQ